MTDVGLEFIRNDGGEAEGLGDAGIETFRDNPFAAVARETGQNSRDARLRDDLPVRITFDEMEIETHAFPSIAEYRKALSLCRQKAEAGGNEKETGFFRNAEDALRGSRVRVLRIADFNTKGVRGPCIEGSPFHSLAKADGVSIKDDVGSGGSFGIGKSAAFALSDLQTVFFSTRYEDEHGNAQLLCMGKSLFISHRDAGGVERRRKGYWGIRKGYMPISDSTQLPEWLTREEQGTSIFSICVRQHQADWRFEVTAAVLMNFFAAVHRGEMEFAIDGGSILINRVTLSGLFADQRVHQAVRQLSSGIAFESARALFACLSDENSSTTVLQVAGLGQVRVRVQMRDGAGYTVGIIRNGMYITDNLAHFNEPFKRFPLYREFAAIVEPGGPTESEWFKRVENPRHDNLSADRITDPELRKLGQKAFEGLAKELRRHLKAIARSQSSKKVELDELNDFFASDSLAEPDDTGDLREPIAARPSAIQRRQEKTSRVVAPTIDPSVDDERAHGSRESNSRGTGSSASRGDRTRRRPLEGVIELDDLRTLFVQGADHRLRVVIFTPTASGVVRLRLNATGLSAPSELTIVDGSKGQVADGGLTLVVQEGIRQKLELRLSESYAGPIEVVAVRLPEAREQAE